MHFPRNDFQGSLHHINLSGKSGCADAEGIRLLAFRFDPPALSGAADEEEAREMTEAARDKAASARAHLSEFGIPCKIVHSRPGAVLVIFLPADVDDLLAGAYAGVLEEEVRIHHRRGRGREVSLSRINPNEPLDVRPCADYWTPEEVGVWEGDWPPPELSPERIAAVEERNEAEPWRASVSALVASGALLAV
jgi:hypothetical protein